MEKITETAEGRTFEITKCLGQGGFGEVYLAYMHSSGGVRSEVALKVLHQGLDPRSQSVERLRDEAKLLGLLNHPSILRIHDLVVLDHRVALVTEFVDGADLDQCIDSGLSLRATIEALAKVGGALNDAYSRPGEDGSPLKLLHRDIKPANIRIGRHGEVKLLDFGIAKAAGMNREAKTQANSVIGSFPYMSPERLDRMEADTHPEGDVYALGATLYEAVKGERLYPDQGVREIYRINAVDERQIEYVNGKLQELIDEEAPESVVELLRRLLACNLKDRPSLGELEGLLEDVAEGLEPPTLSRWCRGHNWDDESTWEGSLTGQTLVEGGASTYFMGATTGESVDGNEPSPTDLPAPREEEESKAAPLPVPPPDPLTVTDTATAGRLIALGGFGVVGIGLAAVIALLLGGAGVYLLMQPGDEVATGEPTNGDDDDDDKPAPKPDPTQANTQNGGDGKVKPEPGGEPLDRDPLDGDPLDADPLDADPLDADPLEGDPLDGEDPEDGVAEVEPGAEPTGLDAICGDFGRIEAMASAGSLSSADQSCLGGAMRNSSLSQVDRAKLGRTVLVDAQLRCASGSCADYEREQKYYFEEIGRSDANMLYAWSAHLAKGAKSDAVQADALLWTNRALERKQAWTGSTHVARVDALLERKAKLSYARFSGSGGNENLRTNAKKSAIEWMNYRIQIGKDSSTAMQLCSSAAGSDEPCKGAAHDVGVKATVTIVSVPIGGMVFVDGVQQGAAPKTVELKSGSHKIEIRSDAAVGSKTITVGTDEPTRWTWRASADTWSGAF